jgi:hypothetical protein
MPNLRSRSSPADPNHLRQNQPDVKCLRVMALMPESNFKGSIASCETKGEIERVSPRFKHKEFRHAENSFRPLRGNGVFASRAGGTACTNDACAHRAR